VDRFAPPEATFSALSNDLRFGATQKGDSQGGSQLAVYDTLRRKQLWHRDTGDFRHGVGKAQPWSDSTTGLFAWPRGNVLALLVSSGHGASYLERRFVLRVRFVEWATGRSSTRPRAGLSVP
jgi:hypothetical protein